MVLNAIHGRDPSGAVRRFGRGAADFNPVVKDEPITPSS